MPLSKEQEEQNQKEAKAVDSVAITSIKDAMTHNIVSIPAPKSHVINEFVPGKLNDTKGLRYSEVKKTFQGNDIKSTRFQLSELALGPLAVTDELETRVQEEVNRRINAELTTLKEKIEHDAHEAGLNAGRKEAHEMVLKNAQPMMEHFEKLISSLENVKDEIARANEDFIIKLVYKLAKLVTLKEIKEDRQYVSRLLAQLIERIGVRENIKVYVNTEDYSAAEQIKTDLAQKLGSLKNISIEADPEVKDQGCRIETDFGEIDARIETQLKNIETTFG